MIEEEWDGVWNLAATLKMVAAIRIIIIFTTAVTQVSNQVFTGESPTGCSDHAKRLTGLQTECSGQNS